MTDSFHFRKPDGSIFEIARPEWAVATTIRTTGLIELLCKCGVGHPAPESVAWLDEHGPKGARGAWGVHGCCGCCLSELDRKSRDLAARQAAAANEEDFDGGEE